MPRFFFDIHDGFVSPDCEGTELDGVIHARLEAVRFAGVYLSQRPGLIWDGSELRVLVFDEHRTLLTTVLLSASDTLTMQQKIEAEEARVPEALNEPEHG